MADRATPAHRPADAYEYEATAPIYHGGVLAYAVGDLVPEANVKAHGYGKDQVKRRPAAAKTTDAPAT